MCTYGQKIRHWTESPVSVPMVLIGDYTSPDSACDATNDGNSLAADTGESQCEFCTGPFSPQGQKSVQTDNTEGPRSLPLCWGLSVPHGARTFASPTGPRQGVGGHQALHFHFKATLMHNMEQECFLSLHREDGEK